ncbi:sulfite exporter TauE/SafE family protein [Chitinispirillales bacterium ANBcel5]|uniref:sulfite exporter TauE/SafE family protein n=1 Tax=Cellulosispirillum alkaliphilum TaxID=3039283 RepID=UPI002A531D47|nr:sulfite exporter TauE/SafE family protein [Chitinispirillales bacterium ANBcel5]
MQVAIITLLTIVASGVGTLSGFGTSTVMVPLLSLFFPIQMTLLFVGIIHLFGNIWKMLLFYRGIRWRLLLYFGIPGVIFSFAGAQLTGVVNQTVLKQLLGVFLIIYPVTLLLKPSLKLKTSPGFTISTAILSGFIAGIIGVGGAIRSAALSAFNLHKTIYIFTNGAISLGVDITRVAVYVEQGTVLTETLLYGMVIYIPASFMGAYLAKRILRKIPQKRFRKIISLFLLLTGIYLLLSTVYP